MNISRYPNSYIVAFGRNTTSKLNLKASNMRSLGLGFDTMLSKTKPKMSDDEFKKVAIEQAQKDAANGIFQGNEFRSLFHSYMSVVSPDRKGIINNLYSKSPSAFMNSLTNYLKITHPSGSQSSGSVIADYVPGRGWSAIGTREEFARSSDICKVYNDAWNAAAKATQGNSASPETVGSSMDIKA